MFKIQWRIWDPYLFIMSKVLANILKGVLDKCISPNQSAFIQERSILDNTLIAFEIIHHLKGKTWGTQIEVALKIDISKVCENIWLGLSKRNFVEVGFSVISG